MVATARVTADELLLMSSDSNRCELIHGELAQMSPTSGEHGLIGHELSGQLWSYLKSHPIGRGFASDAGFVVEHEPDTVLSPDVAFVARKKLPAGQRLNRFVPFAPDLAIEVESPSNREGELLTKVALYLRGGTLQVWLVRPKHRTVTIFRPGESEVVLHQADTLDGGDQLPGFSLSLGELFSVLDDDENE